MPPTGQWVGEEVTSGHNVNGWEDGGQGANWPGHLAEMVQACGATWSAVLGCGPHCLMFGYWPWLPVSFCFPVFGSMGIPMGGASPRHVDGYMATVCGQFGAALQEAQAQLVVRAQEQRQYYDGGMGAMDLKPGNHAFKGRGGRMRHTGWCIRS